MRARSTILLATSLALTTLSSAYAQISVRDLPEIARARAERLRPKQLAALEPFWADLSLQYEGNQEFLDRRISALSTGMGQRARLAVATLHQPAVLILDEPTSGLDAYGAQQVVSSLKRFAERGRTIACTIHQPRAETFALFDQLLLVKAGETM